MIIIFAYKNMVVLGTMPIVFLKVLFYNQDKIVKEDNQMRVGFIGLGIMGKPMAKNLLKAGYDLVVADLNQEAVAELAAAGAQTAANGAGVAEACQVVITMVPNSPHVRAAVLGENGVAQGAKPGTVLIDMSSIDPTESKAIGAELAKKGIEMLDAPVSGGEPKAIDGTISVMVGGKRELFDRYYDLLMAMAGSVVYVGELGSGNVAKLANQIVVAVNIAAVAEALTFAKKAGTDPELVYQAIRGGLAGSTVMDAKAPMMLAGNFKPGFRVELHIKDLTNALNAAHAISAPVPLSGQLMEIMQSVKADGCDKEDHSSIVRFYEKLSNVTVKS
ncbi:2-hydroxy-3-oxopropionate reductase [Enterocloster lavalensis]|uniref:2-hydroxy-3-oxopropionate reductase n=1 Tax=Enterocloster lavalensis TaxID=460384 RepID=UPI002ED06C63